MLRPGSLHFTRGADMLRSGFLEFTLEHSPTKYLVVGDVVSSDEFSAGGYSWRIVCYPHGNERGNADYLSIFLKLVSESKDNIKAIFDVFLMGRDGKPSDSDACWCAPEDNPRWGFPQFVKRRDLAPIYAANGRVTMVCGVIVVCSDPNPVPPPPPSEFEGKSLCGYGWFHFSLCRGVQLSRAEAEVLGFHCCGEKFEGVGVTDGFVALVQKFPSPASC